MDLICTNGHDRCFYGTDPNCPYCERKMKMVGRPRKNVIPFDKNDSVIYDYVERHTSIQTIATAYDVATSEVKRVLKENNIPIRPRGRPSIVRVLEEDGEFILDTTQYLGKE